MEPSETPADVRIWMREIDALRALARAMLGDEHAVEDALQETWLRARARGPEATLRPGAWLATVLRNLVRDRGRRDSRRRLHESARAEEPADLPTPDQVAERLELAQRVAAAAAALPEPYRSAIHLHYFEGLSAAEIAARSGRPLETVRTRLRRGLERMRVRLDDSTGGDRGAWCVALAPLALARTGPSVAPAAPISAASPLASGGGSAAAAFTGALVMSKTLLVAAGALVIAAVAWFAFTNPGPVASPEAAGPIVAGREAEIRELQVGVPRADPRTPVEAPSAQVPAASVSELVTVTGSVVVTDPSGSEHTSESGELRLALAFEDTGEELRELAVEGGFWSIAVPPGTRLMAVRLEAGGRRALLEPGVSGIYSGPDPVRVRAAMDLEVRARWTDAVLLHVEDGAGVELAGVEVRRRSHWRAIGPALHPGDAREVESVVTDAVSPVELPDPGSGLRVVPHWVRAPGFAWRRIDLDHDAGGERTLRLAPGGALELRLLGAVPAGDLFLRLFQPHRAGGWSFEAVADVAVDAGGRARIEDLEPGSYGVRIDRGSYEAVLTLAKDSVTVVAGETAYLELEANAAALDRARKPLAGTLTIPAGLDPAQHELRITVEPRGSVQGQEQVRLPLAEMTPSAGDSGVLAWSAGEVLPARYLASVSGVMHREWVDASSSEPSEAHLVVPPLATVSIRVVEATTGDVLERVKLTWADGELEGVNHNSWAKLLVDASGSFVFQAPRGPIQLAAEARGFVSQRRSLELTGDLVLELPLERAAGVELSFYEGQTRLPIAIEVESLRILDPHSGESLHEDLLDMRTDSRTRRLILRPGSYELRFMRWPEGWEPIDTILVEVPPGEILERRVAVRRSQ